MENNGMRNIDPSLGGSGMSQVAAGSPLENPLFLERLEVFYEKGLADLRAFAQREACPFDEVRRRVAEWHCKSLFASAVLDIDAKPKNKETAAEILKSISSQLEALQSLLGLESFYLAVNPHDPADDGFLGGTLLGREFWRGHRGCGAPGAKAFQLFCQKAGQTLAPTPQHGSAVLHSPLPSAPPPTYPPAPHIPQQAASSSTSVQSAGNASVKKGPASTVKAEVYVTVRNAIRVASGHRNAEMKWSNHARLSAFDVELLGWPPAVPMRNPSALSTAQNQAILDAMKNGSMYFRSTKPPGMPSTSEVSSEQPQQQAKNQTQRAETEECEKDIFDDAIDFLGSVGRLEERTRELTAPPPVAEDSSKAVQSSNDSEDEASVSLLRFEDLHDDSYDPFDMDFIREDPIDVPPRKRKRNDSTGGSQPSPDLLP